MTINNKAASPEQVGDLGNTALETITNNTTLTPRQQRIVTALTENIGGVLSYDLRQIAGAMNIADEIKILRRRGVGIICEFEPFITRDGVKSKIGRYRLEQSRP
ncbi:MAG: hypothetical protein A2511_00860 [Deltaproteobacteria bacterium RIFOXYD12_FULL_50_9]|nr:MAG: hypothetical protein A2511_00860 [Deltaproteobacteria bacterium RIFOXYD12_FULL_50_9]